MRNILTIVVLLLIAVLVFTNLEFFTGKVIKTEEPTTSITVTPKVIKAGEHITVHLEPGVRCVWRVLNIQREGSRHRLVAFERTEASSRYCKPVDVRYKTWSSWEPGRYYVSAKDIGYGDYVGKDMEGAYFTIV